MKKINFILCILILLIAAGVSATLLFGGNAGLTLPTIESEKDSMQDDTSVEKEDSILSIDNSDLPSSTSSELSVSTFIPQSSPSSNQNSVSVSQSSPQKPEAPSSSPQSSREISQNTVTFPININTATKEELMALPEIDGEKADVILHFREAAGGFDSTEDIKQALWKYDGVAIYYKIKDYIICE